MWFRKIWYLQELRRNQWLKPIELQKIQQKKLGAVIKHAYDNVEFYHRRFRDAGVTPNDIKTVEDLSKIPVTTKSDIREAFRSRSILDKKVNLSKCHLGRTGGTSGEPLTIVYDEKAEDFEKAVAMRCFMEIGVGLLDKWAIITSPGRALEGKKWYQRLNIFSPVFLSVFDSPAHHLSVLGKVKPKVIGGPSYSLLLLAKAVQENKADDIRPKVIYGTSEPLTDRVREFVNSTFGVEMFDLFGCVEVGRTAWECDEHEYYHIDVDAVVMEVVDGNEQVATGENGRILYTSLYNYAMPLIRYDVRDMCTLTDDSCPCGRGLPLMKDIVGRTDDLIVAPDGRILPPGVWSITMRAIPGILQYRIVQETKRRFIVELIQDSDFSPKTVIQVENQLERIIGKNSEINVKLVDEIPKDKAGKLRSIISKVKSEVIVQ
jgi:phenylacetate-CoA ligase